MKLRTDLKAALMAAAFILALFVVAMTEPNGPPTTSPSPAPTGSLIAPAIDAPAVHYGIEPGKGFGKAR